MNRENLRRNERLRELLAAEYVVGTLKGGARRRFDEWLTRDAMLRQIVIQWQERLLPMSEFSPIVRPPQRVWDGIERRIEPDTYGRQSVSLFRRLNRSLALWRGLALSAGVAAIALVIVIAMPQTNAPMQTFSYVATLAGESGAPALYVRGDVTARTLTIKAIGVPELKQDHSLELWAVPLKGAPISLGLLSLHSPVTVSLPSDVTPQTTPLLAVSLEPRGGSPDKHRPSGPILYKGSWVAL